MKKTKITIAVTFFAFGASSMMLIQETQTNTRFEEITQEKIGIEINISERETEICKSVYGENYESIVSSYNPHKIECFNLEKADSKQINTSDLVLG